MILRSSWLLLFVVAGAGCSDRTHLYEKTGLAYKRALARQAEEHDAPAPRGLDAIDSNIVMHNYRTLMMQEGKGKGGGQGDMRSIDSYEVKLTPGAGAP